MALTPISERDLRNIARDDAAELRTVPGEGQDSRVDVVAGSWGKRLVRNLSIPFREADKAGEYASAKKAVLDSLTAIYGNELATKVFHANIGRIREDGEHVVSAYHPITGRHVRKMMEQADRELLRKYADPEMGGVRLGRGTSGSQAPQATREWMNAKLFEDRPDEGDIGVGLHSTRLQIVDSNDRDTYGRIAETLFEDADARFARGQDRNLFWTLDVGLGDAQRFMVRHPIGICIDRDEPDKVQVYDGNVRAVTVPREEFAAWVAAHARTEYALNRIELHRAEPMMHAYFAETGGTWSRDSGPLTKSSQEVGDWLRENIGVMNKAPQELPRLQPDVARLPTCDQFNLDVDRENFQVEMGDRGFVLRSGNGPEVLASLVEGGTAEETRRAVLNLSILLNQNLSNTGSDMIANDRKEHIEKRENGNMLERDKVYCGIVPDGNAAAKSVTVTRRDDTGDIHIDFEMTQPLSIVGLPEQKPLDLDASWLKVRFSIDVSLEALRSEGGYNALRTSQLTGETRMTLPTDDAGENNNRIGMFSEGGRFVSDRIGSLDRIDELLQGSLQNDPEQIDGDLPEALTDLGKANLARLLAPQTGIALFNELVGSATKARGLPPDDHAGMRTIFTQTVSGDGQPVVDIVFRHSIPDDLPGMTVFYGADLPPEEGRLETAVSIRIPLAQLNDGLPPTFDFLHAPRLEWTPLQ